MPVSKNFKRGKNTKRSKQIAFRLLCIGLVLLIVLVLIDRQIRPLIQSIASYQAKIYSSQVVNDAVSNQIEQHGYTYDNLSKISKNTDGQVTSIETNVRNINEIHTSITNSVTQKLSTLDSASIHIPLGSFTGYPFFSGRGPKIEIKLIPRGYVHVQIISDFSSTGINQTLHKLVIRISIEVAAIIPGYSTTTNIDSDYILAETVIVGNVPQRYTKVVTDSEQLVRDVNDYGGNDQAE